MLQLTNISLHFGARTIFDEVTVTIKPGEHVGLIGRNGSGKSTMLKLITGELSPNGGQIEYPSGYQIGYLAQSVDLPETQSPREICHTAFGEVVHIEQRLEAVQRQLEQATDPGEQMELSGTLSNLYEKLSLAGADKMEEEVEKVLKGMGFREEQFDAPVSTLSGGWKMRVELSRLLLSRPEVLLLDEPTNHLDIESILWFEQYLRHYEGIVLVVSHDQYVLNSVTNRTIEITSSGINDFPFPYKKAMVKKKEREEHLVNAYENQQREIAHKERLIDKFRAKASKAKFAKALQSELDRMEVIEPDGKTEKTMRLRFSEGSRAGRVVFEAKSLGKSYGDNCVIDGLDLVVERGERIAFVGQNGQGKTTLARMMAGEIEPTKGTLKFGHQLEINYYAQNQTELLDGKQTVLQTLGQVARGKTEGRLRSILGSLLFEGEEVTKKVSVLSGGERARLAFACMVVKPCNVLILDEPTNHLDISSKEILKDALQEFSGTLIVVSHDMEFLSGLTHHTLEFRSGQIKKHLYGIDEFVSNRKIESLRTLEKTPETASTIKKSPSKSRRSDQSVLRKKIQSLERKIAKLEMKKKRMEQMMSEDHFYDTPGAMEMTNNYRLLLSEIDEATAAWEHAVSRVEE